MKANEIDGIKVARLVTEWYVKNYQLAELKELRRREWDMLIRHGDYSYCPLGLNLYYGLEDCISEKDKEMYLVARIFEIGNLARPALQECMRLGIERYSAYDELESILYAYLYK